MSFWKKQPASNSSTTIGPVTKPSDSSQVATPLPDGYSWKSVSDATLVSEFLSINYSDDDSLMICYRPEMIRGLFGLSSFRSAYSLGLFHNHKMVGYIFGKEHTVTEIGRILGVNFLCLDRDHRNLKMAPLLITELTRISYASSIHYAIFANGEDRGFAFTALSYFHMPLNVPRLRPLIHIPGNFKQRLFSIRKTTAIATRDNLLVAAELLSNSNQRMLFSESFTPEQFVEEFTTRPECNYTLFNSTTSEFASFFVLDTKCLKTGNTFRRAYLHYFSGGPEIVEDALCYAQNTLNLDLFDVLDMGRNETEIIDHFGFLPGTGHLFYHLFNYSVGLIGRSRVNFVLF
ncbi:NMT1 [Enterospora canceri]|uniref:Glycylpeptide N-tetradecanoyltransferase n=1 Tax=Enterospora canceri TaxID=1081671 RepID=A0A1Y1S6Z2_9MICR|nr:NMT1 [Enterospora canceri]